MGLNVTQCPIKGIFIYVYKIAMEEVELCIPCIPKKSYKCPHNKQKNYCKDCGGSQICIHEKNKKTYFFCK